MYEIRATWDLLNLNMSTCLTPSCLINWVECNLVWNHMGHLKIKQACKASFIWNLKGVLKLNYEVELPLYYIHFEITTRKQREECENCFGNRTVSMCCTDLKLCTREGWLIAGLKWSLFFSLALGCLNVVHRKTKRRVWTLFWKLDCLAVLYGS